MNTTQARPKSTEAKTEDFSVEDLQALTAIKKITRDGGNAEVKQKKGGGLTVYAVRKQIAVQ